MFNHKHYVPILKAKEGEFLALLETDPSTKTLMTPLFEIVNIAWNYEDETEAKPIEAHLEKIGGKMVKCWGSGLRAFVDSNLIEGNRTMSDGATHHLVWLFNDLRTKGLDVIPVTGIERAVEYKAAIQAIVSEDQKGACLRLRSSDLVNPNLQAIITTDLALYGLTPKDVDLVVDWESIAGIDYNIILVTAVYGINSLPFLADWRTLTIAATNFPTDLSDIEANTIDQIDRNEWLLWNKIILSAINRKPSFSDYSIAHPEVMEMDPRLITVSASIRYTCDDYWLILRGRSTKKFGWPQYHDLCSNLIALGVPPHCGNGHCWGDDYIAKCASPNPTVGPGNSTTWRKVANNHHFQKVVDQISNLP